MRLERLGVGGLEFDFLGLSLREFCLYFRVCFKLSFDFG